MTANVPQVPTPHLPSRVAKTKWASRLCAALKEYAEYVNREDAISVVATFRNQGAKQDDPLAKLNISTAKTYSAAKCVSAIS